MMVSAFMERELDRPGGPVRSGVFLAVVGPSGAGKDTLLEGARPHFEGMPDVMFVQRTITRPAEAAGEVHRAMSEPEFDAAEADGAFAVTWQAHGLKYALPAEVDAHVRTGGVAVVNGSRAVLPMLAERYRNLLVVNVTARTDILAARLARRGRETEDAIRARLQRAECTDFETVAGKTATIDNSGDVEAGVTRLVAEIRRALAFAAVADAL